MLIFILSAPSWEILVPLDFIKGDLQSHRECCKGCSQRNWKVNLNVEPSLITKVLIIVSSTLRWEIVISWGSFKAISNLLESLVGAVCKANFKNTTTTTTLKLTFGCSKCWICFILHRTLPFIFGGTFKLNVGYHLWNKTMFVHKFWCRPWHV